MILMIFLRGTASLGDWSNVLIAMLGYKTAFYRPGLIFDSVGGAGTIDKQELYRALLPHRTSRMLLCKRMGFSIGNNIL